MVSIEKDKKLIVILGPTSSGKSDLAVKIAQKFNGAVVSADSRQVYKGMDIGSGKITKKEMQGIPHYLLDVASPKRRFTVAQYQKLAWKAIKNVWKRGKIPILCGGTGLYIQSIVDGLVIPEVPPDSKLRRQLEKLSTEKLFAKLQKLDPRRARNIDWHNRRRLIRALEIVIKTGMPVPLLQTALFCHPERSPAEQDAMKDLLNHEILRGVYPEEHRRTQNDRKDELCSLHTLQLGITISKNQLAKAIKKRLYKRLKQGMVAEVKKLRRNGISWKRLEEFGLEYRAIAQYLQSKITKQEMINKIQKESEQYAKRQMTWFSAHGGSARLAKAPAKRASGGKRDKRIKWIRNYKKAEKLTRQFLS